jgi:hypothetical protein
MSKKWITVEEILEIEKKKGFYDEDDEVIQTGMLIEDENFCIAYRIVKETPDEEEREMGIEESLTLSGIFCSRFKQTLDVDGLFEVFAEEYGFEKVIEDSRKNWKKKIEEYVSHTLDFYKNYRLLDIDPRKHCIRKFKEIEFLLKTVLPELQNKIEEEVFSKES